MPALIERATRSARRLRLGSSTGPAEYVAMWTLRAAPHVRHGFGRVRIVNQGSSDTAGITLRRAVRGDARAIGAVFDAAVRAGWRYLGELVAEPMITAVDWEQLVADHEPLDALLVAVDETDCVVGYTAVHPEDGETFLLFVHPSHVGRGIGRALLAAAHDALRAAGCTEAHLFVHEQNERALAVYAAAGYRADGSDRVSDFRGTRIREVRLLVQLQASPRTR